jgi:predicted AAA-ATPase/PD-(D/E)XK nuclease superfamily protein
MVIVLEYALDHPQDLTKGLTIQRIPSMALKKLPINISNFRTMVEENFIYVDKTKIIYEILKRERFLFLSRPRRFGKSLLVSTLAELFSGNRELFNDLWIGKHSNYNWQQYPVIQLDFSSLAVRNEEQFQESLSRVLEKIGKHYEVDLSQEPTLITAKILHLIEELSKRNKVVILIDEYDAPLLANINNEEIAEKIRDLMKEFFTTIKSCTTSGQIQAIFVTGVTKFSKTSLFSGFNNLSDMTMVSKAATLLGYTDEELRSYFSDYIQEFAQEKATTTASILESLKKWYNGYCFSENEVTVYNPYSIIFALERQKFSNYWLSSGTPSFLITLLKTQYYKLEDLKSTRLSAKALDVFEIGKVPLIPILFQAGYLTITAYNELEATYSLDFPNSEIREAFDWYILSALTNLDTVSSETTINHFKDALATKNIELFCKALTSVLADIPYQLHIKAEAYYHSLLQVILKLSGFASQSEVITSKGQVDMVIDTKQYLYVFELKFVKTAQEALDQIKNKKYFEKYLLSQKPVVLVGLSFDMKEKELTVDAVREDLA